MMFIWQTNQDGYIDRDEFCFCWNAWIKTVSEYFINIGLGSFMVNILINTLIIIAIYFPQEIKRLTNL